MRKPVKFSKPRTFFVVGIKSHAHTKKEIYSGGCFLNKDKTSLDNQLSGTGVFIQDLVATNPSIPCEAQRRILKCNLYLLDTEGKKYELELKLSTTSRAGYTHLFKDMYEVSPLSHITHLAKKVDGEFPKIEYAPEMDLFRSELFSHEISWENDYYPDDHNFDINWDSFERIWDKPEARPVYIRKEETKERLSEAREVYYFEPRVALPPVITADLIITGNVGKELVQEIQRRILGNPIVESYYL